VAPGAVALLPVFNIPDRAIIAYEAILRPGRESRQWLAGRPTGDTRRSYAMWSSRWYTLLGEAQAICPYGSVGSASVAPSGAQITQADAWMNEAIGNHTYDAQHGPGDASWDAQWSGIYAALIAQWNALVVA